MIDQSAHFLGRKVNRRFGRQAMGLPFLSLSKELRQELGSELEGHQLFFFRQTIGAFQGEREKERTARQGIAKIYKSRSDSPWFFSRTPDFATFTSPRILQITPNPHHSF